MEEKNSIQADVIAQINSIAPDVLQSRGVIALANDGKSFVCPNCGNGTGKSGDGMTPQLIDGAWLYNCFSCGTGYNNVKLLASHYELNAHTDFVEVCKRACTEFNIYLPLKEAKPKKMTLASLIKSDIKNAQANLENLPLEARRGLTLETYKLHGCGYTDSFTTIQSRLEGKNLPPSRRIIIPAGNHYNAVLIDSDRPNVEKKYYKIHAGTKHPFALDFITEETNFIFVVEGEIDAMSLNQVFGVEFRLAIATGGAAVGKDIAREFFDKLESVFATADKKPFILILFDNDDTGKREGAKFCAECIKRGYPAGKS